MTEAYLKLTLNEAVSVCLSILMFRPNTTQRASVKCNVLFVNV
jgi:hypothetical protein